MSRVLLTRPVALPMEIIQPPKKEEIVGEPLSPYALTKVINEKYAKYSQSVMGSNQSA